jgi:hypothetical protein
MKKHFRNHRARDKEPDQQAVQDPVPEVAERREDLAQSHCLAQAGHTPFFNF